jgi:ABC-2 type transport system permease protein
MSLLRTLGAAAGDELRHIGRHGTILLVLVAIPLLYPLVVSWLYRADQAVERPAVLVDLDNSALSRGLTRDLEATQGLRLVARVGDTDAAWNLLRRREAEAVILIPEDFTATVKRGHQGTVLVWTDAANVLTYGVSMPAVAEVAGATNERLGAAHLEWRGVPPTAARARTMAITRREVPLFHPSASYGDFFVPGLFVIVLQQVMLIGLAFSAGTRRELGLPAPARWPVTTRLGRALGQLALYGVGLAFIVLVVFPLFGWSLGSPAALLVLLGAFLVALAPLAVLIADLVPDRLAAFQVLMFASAPLLMMSGYAWPFRQMPGLVRAVASVFPSTPALQAFRTVTMRGGGLADIAPALAWMGLCGAGWLLVAIPTLRWRSRRAVVV